VGRDACPGPGPLMTAPHDAPLDAVWICACGQAYDMTTDVYGTRFWPNKGNAPYSRRGLTAAGPCIRCGARIRGKLLRPAAAPAAAR
jgi:hypothetical protein